MDGIEVGIIGSFIATWGWLAVLSYRMGAVKEKIDLVFAKIFDGIPEEEIENLKRRLNNIEKKVEK